MTFEGKVALITGAGSGIGAATAHNLAKQGAKIAALGRTEDELQTLVDDIEKNGGEAMVVLADISIVEDMDNAIAKIDERWGRLDYVFANAGINGVWAPLDELEPDEWDQTIKVNLRGTYLTVRSALPHLKKQGGAIVITSSVNGTRMFSNSGATAYACTKAAQVAFAKMTALEFAKHRIRVNVICPGAIDTEIDENTQREDLEHTREPVEFPEGKIPLTDGKSGSSEQVADLVAFLLSDAASHITGTELWIDGGQSLLQG